MEPFLSSELLSLENSEAEEKCWLVLNKLVGFDQIVDGAGGNNSCIHFRMYLVSITAAGIKSFWSDPAYAVLLQWTSTKWKP